VVVAVGGRAGNATEQGALVDLTAVVPDGTNLDHRIAPELDGLSNARLAVIARRITRRCASSTSTQRSPSSWTIRVEPSMSVNKNVTVPVGKGRSALIPKVLRSLRRWRRRWAGPDDPEPAPID